MHWAKLHLLSAGIKAIQALPRTSLSFRDREVWKWMYVPHRGAAQMQSILRDKVCAVFACI